MNAVDSEPSRSVFSSPRARLLASALLLFGSGASGLLYQTIWQRSLSLFFGATSEASAAVLSLFMGGLGLGGFVLARRAERHETPLAFYGRLELIVALLAGVSPFLIEGLGHLYLLTGGSAKIGLPLATALRLLVSALAIGPAAFLMGGTLPAMVRAAAVEQDESRRNLGILYGINTLGAVVGALLGTFVLFEVFGTTFSLWLTALVNSLVGMIAIALSREFPNEKSAPVRATSTATLESDAKTRGEKALLFVVLGIVGFVFLGLELAWYRLLTPLLGGSTYSFGLILASVLLGIGLGGALYALRSERSAPNLAELSIVTALEALLALIPLVLGDRLALLAAGMRVLSVYGFLGLAASWSLLLLLFVFPASLVAGYQYPLLLGLLGRGNRDIATDTGRAYAANTFGGVLGALGVGFLILPALGAVKLYFWLCVLLTIASLLLAAAALKTRLPGRFGGAFVAIATSLFALSNVNSGPTHLFRHVPIGAGRSHLAKLTTKNEFIGVKNDLVDRLRWTRDGREAAVALDDTDGVSFLINGKSDGSTVNDKETQAMLALLPLALQPSPKSVFLVGLGSGMSAGFAARVPTVNRVAVSEMESVIFDVAAACRKMNLGAVENPKVKVSLGDAREHLLASNEHFDVIASEPSNPYRAGISMLFTKDFYAVAHSHLTERGIFAQWLQGYEVDSSVVLLVLTTLRSEFRNVEVWQTQANDFLLLAADHPIVSNIETLEKNLAQEPYTWALPRIWHTSGVHGFLSHRVASAAFVDTLVDNAKLPFSTDDQNFLEFSFARSVGRAGLFPMEALLETVNRHRARFEPNLAAAFDGKKFQAAEARIALVSGISVAGKEAQFGRESLATVEGCRSPDKRLLEGFDLTRSATELDPIELVARARVLSLHGKSEAEPFIVELRARGYFAEARHAEALREESLGHLEAALDALGETTRALESELFPICSTPRLALDLAKRLSTKQEFVPRVRQALLRPFSGFEQDGNRRRLAQLLGLSSLGPGECVTALGRQLEAPHWNEEFLTRRYLCLRASQHPLTAKAQTDLEDFLSQGVGSFE